MGAGPSACLDVEHVVADHDEVGRGDAQPPGRLVHAVGVRFLPLHVLAAHDGREVALAEGREPLESLPHGGPAVAAEDGKLNIIVFGAHPDDCDLDAGGTAIRWAQKGHAVKFVSLTNGDAGHQSEGGGALAKRRRLEAQEAGRRFGIAEYEVLDNHDGELLPTLALRLEVIRRIRRWRADLVIAPRPNDYHPDHRATGQLVMDSSYILTVPNMVALTDILPRQPVILSFSDTFTRPCPFQADVVVGIDEVIERKLDMVHCHVSQVYEWLPFNQGKLGEVPTNDADRRRWLAGQYRARFELAATRYRDKLVERYGEKRGQAFRFAEAFEVSEYGAQPDEKAIRRLFPFFA